MSNTYRVNFMYSKDIPVRVRSIVETMFVNLRNKAIKLLNPRYEEWNAEYDSVKDIDDYYGFIQRKQNVILNEFNRNSHSPIKLYSDEECDIAGRFKVTDGKNEEIVEMHMFIQ